MLYRVFNTEADAIAAQAQVSAEMGLPKHGVNAKTGELDTSSVLIERWSDIIALTDGRFCFPSPDAEGVELDESLFDRGEEYP